MKNSAREHNKTVYLNCEAEKIEINADHLVSGNPSKDAREKCMLLVKTAPKYCEVHGLQRILKACIGLAYTTSVNIKTDDGLINGATCVLKKFQYLSTKKSEKPSILWVLFDDESIGKQWRHKYSAYYTEDVDKSWIPIFAVSRQFPVLNGTITRTQFPLKPASGSTIHSAQGCTFNQICVNMDLSDSEGLSKNPNLAKSFLQHAHYVAASRVTTLKGLQLLSWNPELISVNHDVKDHVDYLHKHRKVQLCYTPVYNMIGLKCSFLNTRSLHKNINNVIGNFNICASEIFFMAETRLRNTDTSNTYKIPEFKIVCRNDQAWNFKNLMQSDGLLFC